MLSRTKSPRLSRHASTSHHGQLLQDSGFTKLGSQSKWSSSSAPTITSRRDESSYQFVKMVQQSSGKPVILDTLTLVGPSTYRAPSQEQESTADILKEIRDAWYSLRTSCPPSRSVCLVKPKATQLWELYSARTPSHTLLEPGPLSSLGSTPIRQETLRAVRSASSSPFMVLRPNT